MTDERERALGHVGAIRSGLQAIEAHAATTGDTTLAALAADLHDDCEKARADYLSARGWSSAGEVATFSGGEDKPPQPPVIPEGEG